MSSGSVRCLPLAAEWWDRCHNVSTGRAERTIAIARRRYFKPNENFRRGPRVNDAIRISPIFLIDQHDNKVGEIDTYEAKQMAREAGLDLVEVAPDSRPPVCRILDYGKYKYEQSKKEKAQRARSKTQELKEVRLGRSMKIDPHDIQIRLNQARKFLMEGHKVQIVQNFRGREMQHKDRGRERMNGIIEQLSDIAKLDTPPRMAGRRMNAIFSPDKAKIEQIKRREAKEKAEKEAGDAKGDAAPDKPDESKKKSDPVSTTSE